MQAITPATDKLENGFRFRLYDGFHDQLATGIPHGHGDGRLVHVEPDILVIREGAPCR
jgi:hypothetical protein